MRKIFCEPKKNIHGFLKYHDRCICGATIRNKKPIEGIIDLDTPFAKEIGFTSDKFFGYLWAKPDEIYISFIESLDQGKGNLSKLFDSILEQGLIIKVPTPFPKMQAILEKKGFEQTWEWAEEFGCDCEVWVKKCEVNSGRKSITE